jgi:leucyl aminopeptidase
MDRPRKDHLERQRTSTVPLSDLLLDHSAEKDSVPIWFVTAENLADVTSWLSSSAQDWMKTTGFKPKAGRTLLLPGAGGRLQSVLFGLGAKDDVERTPLLPGKLPAQLPPGTYRFGNAPDDPTLGALAFALASYRFDRYRKPSERDERPRLAAPRDVDIETVRRLADAVAFGRDLVNTPANDLGPEELAAEAAALASAHGAACEIVTGDRLEADFPLIHAVGKGSARPPRLVDIRYGDPGAPKVTLVGKGVVFDTGGLDLKPSAGMLIMKKDMGGAAAALALARLVMEAKLPVRLRLILAIVENAVSGTSFRPLDVIKSRKGLTVEIGNTDAEGRLILADALALADEEAPDLLLDFATLTGAARVALGPDLPPFYTVDEALAAEIAAAAATTHDPVWRLPLWRPYLPMLDSKIADMGNVGSGAFAGSVIAALFLTRFVEKAKAWAHFDIYAWTPRATPGRPEGGEVQAARALFDVLAKRYG